MKKIYTIFSCCCWLMLMVMPVVFADGTTPKPMKVNSGDTTFVLISAAMAMIMTPGGGLFYGGMIRSKNVLSILMQVFFIVGLISIQWVLLGYSLSFGPDSKGMIGSLDWIGLANVGQEPNVDYAPTIPHFAFMIFQAMFAVGAPSLITGAFAERMKFSAFILFVLIWSTLVYDPVTHWIWGTGGWLRELGVLDFAGGIVVHILAGVSGLVIAFMIGPRKGYGKKNMLPHHLPMTILGASLLWFGWLGFNAGSALSASALAVNAFVVTHIAAATATISWVVTEWAYCGKPTVFGAVSGCVAGLVAITPAAGYVSPMIAIIIGFISGVLCYLAVSVLKGKLGYDDALDAFGINGIGGSWGVLATGLFASKEVNPAGADGLFYGNPLQVIIQLVGIGVSWSVAAIGTFLIIKVLMLLMKVRVDESQEIEGLDITEHGQRGYDYKKMMFL